MTNPSARSLTPAQEKAVLIATALASGMGFADMLAVNTALPVIQSELHLSAADALWIAEIYLLFVASLMMMGGALGDRFGRRRILHYGILAFAAASLFCAASGSSTLLIFGRAAQGLAAALILPSSLALLNACFPPERRGRAIGSWTAISSMMIPLGPLAGGAAVDFLSWHWIFLINLPLCAVALGFLRAVPRPPYAPQTKAPLDIAGMIGITGGLGALVFGLVEGTRLGFSDHLVVGALIASAILLPLTVLIEAKSATAMVPVWMFRQRTFLLVNLQTFLFFAGFQGTMFLLPFFHIQVFGFTALEAGAAGLPIPIAIILLSRPVGRLMDLRGPGPLLATAPFVVGAGLLLLSQVPAQGDYLHHILPAVVLIAIGLGLFIAPVTTVALNAAGDARSGLASAVNNTVARVAGLVSVAVMGVILTTGYGRHLPGELGPVGLTRAQLSTIAEQVQQLATLQPPPALTGAQLQLFHGAVAEAFTRGFASAVTTAAGLMLLAGVIGFLGLRKVASVPKIDNTD
ncbi:MAG: MFS transporter [Rhodospirillales bacterium]|nr:MFS transporter [Rhodospirillales bacterium]